MFPLNQDEVTDQESFYVILLTLRGERAVPDPAKKNHYKVERHDYHAFFKADRYRCYGSSLHTEPYASDAKQWKTPEGANVAMKRLVEKGTIKDRDRPVVCKYTRTVTRRLDTIIFDADDQNTSDTTVANVESSSVS